MSAAPPLAELRGLSKHFGEGATRVDALVDISMAVHPGEVIGLLGPSGSGKSTLLYAVGCVAEPNAGWISLDGEVIYDNRWMRRDLRRLRLTKIGFVFQQHNLLGFLNSTENVAEVMELAGIRAPEARARAEALLERLSVGHRRHAMPGELSGGEAQRVAIARALANDPRLILADEPTAALDSERAGRVMDLLRAAAHERGAAAIVVTHDDKIFDRFDRILHLRDGRLVREEARVPIPAGHASVPANQGRTPP
ncbi:MAG: ABC transporter [Rhodospirillales bacterium 70-18]|nr:ABC transporter ATP-binding protein [Rhodospirillales bacterium]OJY76915.1 MAG: ABC transporter [Rhodospirillales bacterium 70-18]